MKYFLTIAASDNSGGAGIQNDIKVAHDSGYWALSAITGITVQDFKSVFEVEPVKPYLLQWQIDQCFRSFPVQAVKIGAICSIENLGVIVDCLKRHPVKHVVLDPVLFSTSGKSFLDDDSIHALKEMLFPLTELITPNKMEFEILTNSSLKTIDEGIDFAKTKCYEWNTSILLKGGHFDDRRIKEVLITKDHVYRFERERRAFMYEHGTGCTLSSLLACHLGDDLSFCDAYLQSSDYLVKHYDSLQKIFS